MYVGDGAASKSASCTADTFVVSPASGRLAAAGNLQSTASSSSSSSSSAAAAGRYDSVVRVHFTPHSCDTFDAVLTFGGLLEERPCHLRVCGQGTYDEQYKAVISV